MRLSIVAFSIMTHGTSITTLNISIAKKNVTAGIMTHSITTIGTMALRISTFSNMTLRIATFSTTKLRTTV
jgi:hypothetical protein